MRSFEIESFNPQLLKAGEGGRFLGLVDFAKEGMRKGRRAKGDGESGIHTAEGGAQSSESDWYHAYVNA